jgi:hypothetical protein
MTSPQSLVARTWAAFLLRDEERVVLARTSSQQRDIEAFCNSAERRARVAHRLEEPDATVAALTLYREAAVFYIAALAKSKDAQASFPLSPAEAWNILQSLLSEDSEPGPEGLADLHAVLVCDGPMTLDRFASESRRDAPAGVRLAVEWLAGRVGPRQLQTVRTARFFRAAALIGAISAIVFFAGRAIVAPKNLALRRPTFQSSHRPGSPEPGGVNNGEIEGTFGVHTNVENDPWVEIDLERSQAIREVRVYNRGDGWTDGILPLELQFSLDGKTWTDIARRDTLFGQTDPWIAPTRGTFARYVRVRRPGYGCVVLSEIEVY